MTQKQPAKIVPLILMSDYYGTYTWKGAIKRRPTFAQ